MSQQKIDKVLRFYRNLNSTGYTPDARTKPFWHRANFGSFLRGDDFSVRPVTVEYWPSALCNSRCSLCPYRRNGARSVADSLLGETSQRSGFFADEETARHVASECRRLGVLSFLLTGGGEPFMNPDVAKVAQAFVDQGLAMGVYTNGTVPSREHAIRAIADLDPRFVRISVNAGSAAEHEMEYGFSGGWDTLKRNSRLWATVLPPKTSLSFSWVLTGQEPRDTYKGAVGFLCDLYRATRRPIAGHFRPKYIYYNPDGSVHRPGNLDFGVIRRSVDEFIRPAVIDDPAIDIQVNTYAIEISREHPDPQSSFATGWATSFTHRGDGYITSELNGSTWPDTCWGTLRRGKNDRWPSINALWSGEERKRLCRLYANQARLPVYHKLTGITNVLKDIRALYRNPFTERETAAFWSEFDAAGFERPCNWDFI